MPQTYIGVDGKVYTEGVGATGGSTPTTTNTHSEWVTATSPGGHTYTQQIQVPDTTPEPTPPISGAAPSDQSSQAQPPAATPSSSPQDIQNLQNYLVQHGYLTPQQVATGPGIYGPQTTAAVAKMHQDMGVQPEAPVQSGTTTAAKYTNAFQSLSGTQAPDSQALAASQIQTATQPSTDPVFNAMATSMSPIMDSLNQVLSNINNPALTAVSLQSEYNQLQQQYNLPGMQADLLNMQNVMNGTEQDIRDEITSTGGTATESQVLGMTAARNKVILKQYNALATQYQAAQTNVQNMMQYASTDQQTALSRATATAGIVENLASIQQQMVSMGMTMQQNTANNLNKIVTNVGYSGLAAQAAGNPMVLGYYESVLGLAPGSLSNQQTLNKLETLRQIQYGVPMPNSTGPSASPINNAMQAIAQFESGGSYTAISPQNKNGDYSYGKYQILGSNIPTWTQAATGQALTPQEFLNNPQAQDATAQYMIGQYWNQYGNIQDVASMWFTGKPASQSGGLQDVTGTTSQQYIDKVTGFFNSYSSSAPGMTAYNSGLSNGTGSNAMPGGYITTGSGNQLLVAVNTTGTDTQGRPYAMTSTQAKNLLQNGATIDPGTNNMVVPGVGYYVGQPDGSYKLSLDPNSVDGQFIQYRNRAENPAPWQPTGTLSNQRMTRNALTRQTNAALSQYVDSTLYKNVSASATYLAKLNAGLQNPGSVGDPDIIDSLVKINTGGQGQITEQQYDAYAQGQTWADKFQVVQGKVVSKGGTLSPAQRSEIASLAQSTFSQYRGEYEQMYVEAMKNLENQGIPDAFWGNMPDWTTLIAGGVYTPADTTQ